MTDITDHLAVIERRVAAALSDAERPANDVMLLAVSKGQPASRIAEAHAAGIRHFGENYLDEAVRKIQSLADPDICWHFIGRIQSNKTRPIASHFDWVHTIDRQRIAKRLNDQRPAGKPALNVLIQVNLAGETQKGGVEPNGIAALADAIDALPNLKLRGLMTIPPAGLSERDAEAHFTEMARLLAAHSTPGRTLDTLSMGMSGDFETAIRCGATCIRIGTAIFGERPARPS